ncbi:hypothetical protein HNP38_001186 [Chryseobacterium defluvii]|uniref:Cytochrome C551 n=1 Tax=Chryseobacterium defluvii TaxID=160396 RepID=A0A840KDS5_9FLAO|nr:cytochrome C551 [Chryseobacterium defluvii]MBB4805914.1 hypothetical protein [Chryseobacterium defluvii]
MKKFLLLTIGLGIFAVSCGTKESSMPSNSTDSTAADTTRAITVPPATNETATTRMTHPESIRIKIDSAATTPVK